MNSEVEEVKPRSWFYGIDEILEYCPQTKWILKKLIPQESIVGVVGASGSGKSFIVYDIMMSYLNGFTEWFDIPMKGERRDCVLLPSEGNPKLRLQGWMISHKIEKPEAKLLILDPANIDGGIRLSEDKIDRLIEKIEEESNNVGLVVFDTLNGFYKGEENNNSDMGEFLNQMDKISKRLNATVIVIHHTGKNEEDYSGRGASAFNAKLDMNLSVGGKPDTGITVTIKKSRDSEEKLEFTANTEKVTLTYDEEGEPVTTLVISEATGLKKVELKQKEKQDSDFLLIQAGISEGFLTPDKEGYIPREYFTSFFSSHGGKDGKGYKGENGPTNQSASEGSGVCARLRGKGCLEWSEERKSYHLVDTPSFCWKR